MTPAVEQRTRLALWRDVLGMLGEFARAHPVAFAASLALQVTNVRAGIFLVATAGIVDALVESSSAGASTSGTNQALLLWFAVYIVATVIEELYWLVEPLLSTYLVDQGTHRITRRILQRAADTPLIEFENPVFFDRLQRASEGHGQRLLEAFRELVMLAHHVLNGASVVVTLALVDVRLVPLLIAGSLPALWLQLRVASAIYAARRAHATPDRVGRHIQTLLLGPAAAGEVRLFDTAPNLIDRWRTLRLARRRDVLGAERRRARLIAIGNLLSGAAYAGALTLAIGLILGGQLSIGGYVAVAAGGRRLQEILGGGIFTLRALEEHSQFLGDLFDFLRHTRVEQEGAPVESSNVASAAGRGIALEAAGVRFAYPGAREPVLTELDLSIAAGERIAIVGENGAGKTTLAKLLVGLYQPTGGVVRLNGERLTQSLAVDVRRRIAAVFQDYATFQLTARESIGFGDVSRIDDTEALRSAAERAGIADLIASLPEGYDSFVGRQFGGVDLSGGQWQRLALARAFLRDADLLLLDEPTAALDPLAELALFERFADLTVGRTAIMISHRLGAARIADRVLVLKHGRLIEDGHHDALVAAGGEYARLFAAQAQWYRPRASISAAGAS